MSRTRRKIERANATGVRRLRRVGPWLGAVALMLGGAPLAAQVVPIDELRALRPDAVVEIVAVEHSLIVEAWDRNEIQIQGEYNSAIEVVEIEGGEARFRFEVQRDRRRGRRQGSQRLDVRVPRGVRLVAESVSGHVEVVGLAGALTVETVSGSIDVGGDLATASLESVSGSVRYRGNARVVDMESVSGTIEYEGTARDVQLESVSGSVILEGGAEGIDAETVSGHIRIRSNTPVRFFEASSVSGQVRFEGTLAPSGRIDAESHSGTVELALGSDTNAEFQLSTFSGSVTARVPGMEDEVSSQGRGPGQTLRFSTGSRSGRVRASSFSGSVRITGR